MAVFEYKCPKCGKPLSNELDIPKVGIEPSIWYTIESGLRAIVGSGRGTYWACMNPECRCFYSEGNKFWFKIDTLNKPVPKSFFARELGFYPPKKKKKKRGGGIR